MHLLAYVDPGTGALIWQSIVGACVGVVFYFKTTRKWLCGLLARLLGRRPKTKTAVSAVGGKVEGDRC
jgi:hypothetical protein